MMKGGDLPSNGFEWHALRQNQGDFSSFEKNYNFSTIEIIKQMIHEDPSQWPSANEILSKFIYKHQVLDSLDQEILELETLLN